MAILDEKLINMMVEIILERDAVNSGVIYAGWGSEIDTYIEELETEQNFNHFDYKNCRFEAFERAQNMQNENKKNGIFNSLNPENHYLIIDGLTGQSRGDGLTGSAVMSEIWSAGDEAWPAGEQEFSDDPVEIAE